MKSSKSLKLLFILVFTVFLTSCSAKYQYQTIEIGTSEEDVVASMHKDASYSKDENENKILTFEECPYLGKKGTATYSLSNNALQFSKWEYSGEDREEAKKLYDDICNEKAKIHGNGNVLSNENDTYMTNWNTDEAAVSVSCLKNEEEYVVSLLEIVATSTNDTDNP